MVFGFTNGLPVPFTHSGQKGSGKTIGVAAMNLLTTLRGSMMEGFLPAGWDLDKIDQLADQGVMRFALEAACTGRIELGTVAARQRRVALNSGLRTCGEGVAGIEEPGGAVVTSFGSGWIGQISLWENDMAAELASESDW